MAIPNVANVYPNRVHTSGRGLVRILGGSFAPQVEVRFGDLIAPRVLAVNHALLFVEVPPSSEAAEVLVTAQNLDFRGAPVAGELAESTAPFVYARAALTSDSVLTRVVEAFILMLRRETIPNVTTAHVHTDYDASTGDTYNLTELQTLPALIVTGPEIIESAQQVTGQVQVPGYGFQAWTPMPYYGDLKFSITGAAGFQRQILNLQNLVLSAIHRRPFVEVPRDPDDPAQGNVRFGLDFETGGAPSIEMPSDENDVRTFALRVAIRDVPLGEVPGFAPVLEEVVPPVGDCGVEVTFTKV